MAAYVFPGQGSQIKGMGGELFDVYSDLTAKANDILGYSIKELCLNDAENQLGKTQFTQPALYVVNAFTYLEKVEKTDQKPDFVAGHSLGEYNALFAAGVFDFETGLKLVNRRGWLMSEAKDGGMAAVIGLDEEHVRKIIRENKLDEVDIANFNSPYQIVLSGPENIINSAKSIFEKNGAQMYVKLKVSGAFHSRYMADAAKKFSSFLNRFNLLKPQIPVIANVTARPYKADEIKANLVNQIVSSVKWTETIRYIMGKGNSEFIQIGPGRVLTSMIAHIKKESEPLIVNDEEGPEMDVEHIEDKSYEIHEQNVEKDTLTGAQAAGTVGLSAETLGNGGFRKMFSLKYAYLLGSMGDGISSAAFVNRAAKAGMLAFLGTRNMDKRMVEESISNIQKVLINGEPYGVNLIYNPYSQYDEEQLVDLLLQYNVSTIEASAYITITRALVKYRAKGLERKANGTFSVKNRIIAKLSRPEIAIDFLNPAPEKLLQTLLSEKQITKEEAELASKIPMADALTVEADSAWQTDISSTSTILPTIIRLRDKISAQNGYENEIFVGSAGGIGTPEAATASFIMGADYIETGSINQCTVESGTSNLVKSILQSADIQDTEYAPSPDLFEFGNKIQVLKKGLFFPSRANRLYELYRQFNSLDEIDELSKAQLQERYFKKSFAQVFEEMERYSSKEQIEKAGRNPKYKMLMVFKWYFFNAARLALSGDQNGKVDYLVNCGQALGAFNRWVKGTELEPWENRHIDEIGKMILEETVTYIKEQYKNLISVE